jgi:hypothetical protein
LKKDGVETVNSAASAAYLNKALNRAQGEQRFLAKRESV